MSVLPKHIREMYYKSKTYGPLGRLLGYAAGYTFMAGVKILNIKPWQDLAALSVVSHQYKFIYIGIPKIATRSFKDALIDRAEDKSRIEWTEKPGAFREAVKKYPDYFCFTFVRHPFSRVLSCYNSKIEKPTIGKRARIMSLYEGLHPGMSFEEFARWLNSEEGRDEIADRHWISQYLYTIDQEGENICDFTGKYERLEQDWKTICDKTGLPYRPLSQKGWNSAAKSQEHSYDDTTLQNIRTRYATDFELLNYNKDKLNR